MTRRIDFAGGVVFSLIIQFDRIALAGYPIRLMKFPARDFNFRVLLSPLMFLFICIWLKRWRSLRSTFIDISKVDLFMMVLILLWSEQNWIFLKRSGFFKKVFELGTKQKDCHEEYTYRIIWGSQNKSAWDIYLLCSLHHNTFCTSNHVEYNNDIQVYIFFTYKIFHNSLV